MSDRCRLAALRFLWLLIFVVILHASFFLFCGVSLIVCAAQDPAVTDDSDVFLCIFRLPLTLFALATFFAVFVFFVARVIFT